MKKIMYIAAVILAILLAVTGGYYAGRKSVKPVLAETFYATIEEIRDQHILVQGLEINDVNKRWKFEFTIDEDTELVWRGVPITVQDLKAGDLISITYTGLVAETSPAQIQEVVRIQALGDDLTLPDSSK